MKKDLFHNFSKGAWIIVGYLCCLNVFANTQGPFDYYKPAPDRLLENVEKYHLSLGHDKARKGQYEYAWSEFAFMLHYFPNHPKALQAIADLSVQLEQPQRANRYFERALRLYPDHSSTYKLYGIYLHKTQKYAHAISQYEKALALKPDAPEVHYNLGLSYLALKEYSKANEQAQIAYQNGYPLPALRHRLQAVKAWKESPTTPIG